MSLLTKIQRFFGKQDLITALERTTELLEKSKDSDWSNLSASEVKAILKLEIHKLKENREFDKLELAVLYAPTGNIQETAMQNDWHKEYLEIAEVIDKHTK